MNKIIALGTIILGLTASTLASAQTEIKLYEHSSCRSAIEQELLKEWPKQKVQKVTFTEIPDQGMFEVSALIYAWSPTSASSSGYFYMVSATCQRVGNDFAVWNDMAPAEGGISVKTITKSRF